MDKVGFTRECKAALGDLIQERASVRVPPARVLVAIGSHEPAD